MMLHMIDLLILEISRLGVTVVHEVVHQVINFVPNQCSESNIIKMPSWQQIIKRQKQEMVAQEIPRNRRHYQSVSILREGVVDAMEREVHRPQEPVERKVGHPVVFTVKKETVQHVFAQSPIEDSEQDFKQNHERAVQGVEVIHHVEREEHWG